MSLNNIIIVIAAFAGVYQRHTNVIHTSECAQAIGVHLVEHRSRCVGDTLNGEVVKYYKSGRVMERAFFTKGLRNGPCTIYTPDGTVVAELSYKQDKLDGLCKRYDKRGDIEREIFFTNGIYNGKWINYVKGSKTIEASFRLGKINDWFYDYYKNGVIKHKIFYNNGEIVSGEYLYDKKGVLKHVLISNKEKNRLVIKAIYDKRGNRIKLQPINQMPLSYFLFGASAHTE